MNQALRVIRKGIETMEIHVHVSNDVCNFRFFNPKKYMESTEDLLLCMWDVHMCLCKETFTNTEEEPGMRKGAKNRA